MVSSIKRFHCIQDSQLGPKQHISRASYMDVMDASETPIQCLKLSFNACNVHLLSNVTGKLSLSCPLWWHSAHTRLQTPLTNHVWVSPFFFGPLQTTASSLLCRRNPMDMMANLFSLSAYTGTHLQAHSRQRWAHTYNIRTMFTVISCTKMTEETHIHINKIV